MKQFIGVGILIFVTACFAHKASGNTTTIAVDPSYVSQLGQGYNSITEQWKSQCIRGNTQTLKDNSEARFVFDRTLTESEIESSFGFKVSAKATLGLFSGSARSSFAKSTASSSHSRTMVYKASVVTGTDLIEESSRHWLVPKNDSKFFTQCGDRFVEQITRGGELYILVRMDFASENERMAFDAAVSGNYGLNSGSAEAQAASKAFSHRASVHMEAYQYGGDAYLLGHALGPQSAVTCDMDNLAACDQFMKNALAYATNDFTKNIKNSSAALRYVLRDWKDYNAGASAQNVSAAVQTARDALLAKLRLQIDIQNRYDALQATGYFGAPQTFRTKVEGYNDDSKRNVQVLEGAIKLCYDNLKQETTTSNSNGSASTSNESHYRRLVVPPDIFRNETNHSVLRNMANHSVLRNVANHSVLRNEVLRNEMTASSSVSVLDLLNNVDWVLNSINQCVNSASYASLTVAGYKDLHDAYKEMDLKLPVNRFQGRSDYVKSITPGIGYWGGWSNWAMCPAGQFAIGYKIRAEGSCGDCDDTALNAIELTCANWARTQVLYRKPHSGLWGAWQPEDRCSYGPINGMSIRIESKLGEGHDDTAANDLRASCASGQEIHAPGGLGWGSFSEMKHCPAGSAVCGARVRFEGDQGGDDDTTMNGIELACCGY